MNESLIYLLKVSGGLAIIFLPYYLLFRNDPNLTLKRFYLLAGTIMAWIFPLISFRRPELLLNLTPAVFIDLDGTENSPITMAGTNQGITVNWIQILVITYVTGLIFMFLKDLFIILKWSNSWKSSNKDNGVAFTDSDQVFTLFSKIFVPSNLRHKKDLYNLLLHEKAHIQQLHFIDLMLMEFTLLLTWFNPFSWLISRMIKENHEHLADRQVLSAGVNPARYRAQLLNHTLGVNVFRLGNQFNHSLTLKRFTMMKKPKKSPLGIVKIALLIPAVLITLGITIGMTPSEKVIKGKVVFAETGEAANGAAVIIKGTPFGTIVDSEGLFSLEVQDDSEIVISFVGYSNIEVKASKITNKPLKLEQKVFNVDPEPEKGQKYQAQEKVIKDNEVILSPKETKAVAEGDIESHPGDEVFYIVEDMPMFPGGKEALRSYIYSNLKYPEKEKNNDFGGEVLVQFVVTTTGKIEDPRIARSTHKKFNSASLEVFKNMPDWNPGMQRGIPVKVQVVVPVRFKADKG